MPQGPVLRTTEVRYRNTCYVCGLTDEDRVVQLSELVDELGSALIDGQLFALRVHAAGRVSGSGQQHARLLLIQAGEGRARLKSLRRRRVGVAGHDLRETRGSVKDQTRS